MGTAFRNVRPPAGHGLYPLVVLPSVAREAVKLVRCPEGRGAFFPTPVRCEQKVVNSWGNFISFA